MATLRYPTWLSAWYRLGRVLRPANRIAKQLGQKRVGPSFRVLLFHDIPDEQIPIFYRLVSYLVSRHRIIHPSEVETFLTTGNCDLSDDQIPYLLTFDDGFESQAVAAKKVLSIFGIKAVFFVCPGLLEKTTTDHRDTIAESIFDGLVPASQLPAEMRLMSWDMVNELEASGHTIGSHALTHKRLSWVDDDERDLEISLASDMLQEQTGKLTSWFAYPFGDLKSIDEKSLKLIADRYSFCCTGLPGENGPSVQPLGILRYNIDLELSFQYQLFVLEGGMDRFYRSAVLRYLSMLP